jgi:hypothetical protein
MTKPKSWRGGEGAGIVTPLDLRIAFLARAWARLTLVESGEMDPEEAVVELIESVDRRWLLKRIVGRRALPCACECDILGRWEQTPPPAKRRQAA